MKAYLKSQNTFEDLNTRNIIAKMNQSKAKAQKEVIQRWSTLVIAASTHFSGCFTLKTFFHLLNRDTIKKLKSEHLKSQQNSLAIAGRWRKLVNKAKTLEMKQAKLQSLI
jgi:hypothetical protein